MAAFHSHRAYHYFKIAVKNERRYVRSESVEAFLQSVVSTAEERAQTLPKNTFVWRSQLGHGWQPYTHDGEVLAEIPAPFSQARMTPQLDRATEGRANPKGIPYLYLATTRETAMAEARPGVGALISLAQFRTNRNLNVVDCAPEIAPEKVYIEDPQPEEWETIIWSDINRAFAEPVTRSDDIADYAPTQILAELFRSEGYDGLVYKSSLASGHNLVLFELNAAVLVNCALFEAKSVEFRFDQVSDRYFVHETFGNGDAA